MVEEVKHQAYKNLDDLVPFSELTYIDPPTLSSSLHAEPFYSSSISLLDVNNPLADQDYVHMTNSAPYAFEVGNGSSPEVSQTNNCHPTQAFCSTVVNSFEMKNTGYGVYNEGNDTPSGSLNSVIMTGNLTADDMSKVRKSTWQRNEHFYASNNQSADFVPSDI